MNHYLVQLRSHHGEYEDYIHHLITAANEFDAGKLAIENQAYGELAWEDDDFNSAEDIGGEIYLVIWNTQEIPDDHFKILSQYF